MSHHVPDISDLEEDITPRRTSRQQTREKRTRRYKPVMFVNIIHVKEYFLFFTSTFLTLEPELSHLPGTSLGTLHLCVLHWHVLLQKPTPLAEVNLKNSLSFQKFSRRGLYTIVSVCSDYKYTRSRSVKRFLTIHCCFCSAIWIWYWPQCDSSSSC